MDKEKIEEYSRKYKRVQKKLSVGIMVFILLLGIGFIGVGVFFLVYEFALTRAVIGGIMLVAGILNCLLGIKFNSYSQKNLREMPAEEAARRYSRITGKK